MEKRRGSFHLLWIHREKAQKGNSKIKGSDEGARKIFVRGVEVKWRTIAYRATNKPPYTSWTMRSTKQIRKSAEQSSKRAKGIADERTVEVSREEMDDYLIKTSWQWIVKKLFAFLFIAYLRRPDMRKERSRCLGEGAVLFWTGKDTGPEGSCAEAPDDDMDCLAVLQSSDNKETLARYRSLPRNNTSTDSPNLGLTA